MTARIASAVVLAGFSASLAAPLPSEAQEAAFAKWAGQTLKSPAAKWFGDVAASCLLDRTINWFLDQYHKTDINKLHDSFAELKKQCPEHSREVEILDRMVRPDVTKDELEKMLKDLLIKVDQNATKPQLPVEPPASQVLDSLRPQPAPLKLDLSQVLDSLRRQPTPFMIDPSDIHIDLSHMHLIDIPGSELRLWDVGEKIRGAWAFEISSPDGSNHTAYCYIFGADGNFASYWTGEGKDLSSATGTYTTVGCKVTIRRASEIVETAAIDQVDNNHLRFELTDHSSAPWLVGLKYFLTRVSDPVTTSIIAVSNPTLLRIKFSTRWALMDGMWTEWREQIIGPFETLRVTGRGGIHCQVQFDSSFAEGYQEKRYCIPFDIVTAPSDPLPKSGGMPYRFETDGAWIDLKQDNSITPANVGVQ